VCSTKVALAAAAVIVVLSFAVSLYFYSALPESMATHWGMSGQANGYMPKLYGAFLMPVMLAGLALLLFEIPRIDPLRANIDKFRKHYHGFIVVFCAFMLLLHLQVIMWSMGVHINPSTTMPLFMGVLFYCVGVMVENAKRNWFIGIRTPWTLSSDSVWDKTHKLGGKLFKVSGIVALFGVIFPLFAFYLVIVPILSVAFYTMLYSYLEFKKEERLGKIPDVAKKIKEEAAAAVVPAAQKKRKPALRAKRARRAAKKKPNARAARKKAVRKAKPRRVVRKKTRKGR
jgi:uncharacterized membrane protein